VRLIADLNGIRVAVLGAGRIGSSLAWALRKCGFEVIATARRDETLESVRRLGITAIRDNRGAVESSDVVVISVKPYQLPHLASEVRGFVNDKLVVSVVAGVRRATLERVLQANTVYRAMPNINIRIGMSATALSGVIDGVNSNIAERMFKCAGTTYWVPEEWLDVWTALVGSLPAYVAVIVDSLVLGAISMGFPRDLATKAVLDTIKATAEHLSLRTVHPAELRDEVTTPGGVTIEGLKVLESRGVPASMIEVIEKSAMKAEKLGSSIEDLVEKLMKNPI
jgi:pyrroline-5-carboxylate reductase